jgi:hypothetical protein
MLLLMDDEMLFEKSAADEVAWAWNFASRGPAAISWSWTESRPKNPMRKHASAGGWKT